MNENLAWLLDVVTTTKETLVDEDGIGSDLPPLIAAFDSKVGAIGQAQVKIPSESPAEQFGRLLSVATIMRSGWGAEALGVVLEGYTILVDDNDRSQSMASRFANGDKNIVECISVVYATTGDVTVVSLPYKVEVGRKVKWLDSNQEIIENAEETGMYPKVLKEIMDTVDPIFVSNVVPREISILAIATEIVDKGFYVVCDGFSEESMKWLNGE